MCFIKFFLRNARNLLNAHNILSQVGTPGVLPLLPKRYNTNGTEGCGRKYEYTQKYRQEFYFSDVGDFMKPFPTLLARN